MRYKNLFFDLDDTLWDTCHNNRECLKELYADYHFDRHYASFEAFYDFYMPHNLDLWAKYRNGEVDRQTLIVERFLYVLRPLGIESRQAALDINRDFLERTATKSRLISGAADLLRYLRPSYRIFILSNGFREVQSRKLASAGIDSFFRLCPAKHQLAPFRVDHDRRLVGGGHFRRLPCRDRPNLVQSPK